VRISIDTNLLSTDFPFKPKRNLKDPRGGDKLRETLPIIWGGHGLMRGTIWKLLTVIGFKWILMKTLTIGGIIF